jgi:hypothetical protein
MKFKLALASLIASFALPAFARISAGTPGTLCKTLQRRGARSQQKGGARRTTKAVGKDTYSSKAEAQSAMGKIPECSK